MGKLLALTLFRVSRFLMNFLSLAEFLMCVLYIPKCAHACLLSGTVAENMNWKICLLKSTICWSLAEGKLLGAENTIICYAWKLMAGRPGSLLAEGALKPCVHARAHAHTHTHTDLHMLELTCAQWKDEMDKMETPSIAATESRTQQCGQSFHEKRLLLLLLLELIENRNIGTGV